MNRGTKILVVEDSPTQAKQLEYMLEGHGFQVMVAVNGKKGLTSARKFKPALIISDVMMPVMDGFEMCGKIRSDKTLKDTPVILLTTLSDLEDIFRGLNVEADCYVTKPWNEAFLISKIEDFVAKKPVQKSEKVGDGLEFTFAGKRHTVTSDRQQMLNLLISTYENAVLQNRELIKTQESLEEANEDLEKNLHELGASEERFRSLVKTIPDIVYRIDVEGNFSFINDAIQRLGYEPDELLGSHFSKIIVPVAVDGITRNKVIQKLKGKATGDKGAPKLFDERRTGDRKTTGLEVQLLPRGSQSRRPGLVEPIGDAFVDVEVNSAGMYQVTSNSEEVVLIGTVGVIRDISDRKKLEQDLRKAHDELEIKVQKRTLQLTEVNKALEREVAERGRVQQEIQELYDKLKLSTAQMMQSEKMSAVGTLVAGVAHEMNNPMMGILNFAQYCLRHTDETDRSHAALKSIERETKRCIRIVKNLLTFSRLESDSKFDYHKESIAVIIERVLGLLAYRIEKGKISITTDISENIPPIWMKPGSMQQVMLNFVSNALDAVKDMQKKEVRVEAARTGKFLRVMISDTGAGIEPQDLVKIYDPFFTTKPPGKGTGLGLSVSRSIIDMHQGRVSVDSKPGEGTTFEILFSIERRREKENGEAHISH